ncbi:MAG: HAD family hydrolase [Clostridia bacterium]
MKKPIIAIMYDFDKTLSTKDMQEYSFIPSLNMSADEFWDESNKQAQQNNMDHILSTMWLMLKKHFAIYGGLTREALVEHGKKVILNNGVLEWFSRVNSYGEELGVEIRHYIISCGLKPMIEGTGIAKYFRQIYACDFVYNDKGNAIWPSVAINYTSKVQFLFRINKGIEDVSEHIKINMHMADELRPVPFSNMIYIGDGLTDVPSMKLTRLNGGYAIGVYQDITDSTYLVNDDRVNFYVKADYAPNTEMDDAIKIILKKIATDNNLHFMEKNNRRK